MDRPSRFRAVSARNLYHRCTYWEMRFRVAAQIAAEAALQRPKAVATLVSLAESAEEIRVRRPSTLRVVCVSKESTPKVGLLGKMVIIDDQPSRRD